MQSFVSTLTESFHIIDEQPALTYTATMRRTLLYIASIVLAGLAFQASGCVTAHEGSAVLRIVEFPGNKPVEGSLLLTVRSASRERSGHWWVAEEDSGGGLEPHSASVRPVTTGTKLHQEGHIVMTLGPYVRSRAHGWEYWVFHKNYQPDDFLDMHLDRAHLQKKQLKVSLQKILPGHKFSDEKVLDGARIFCRAIDLLPATDPDASRLAELTLKQVREVMKTGRDPRDRSQAKELFMELKKGQKKFLPVKKTTKHNRHNPKPQKLLHIEGKKHE